MGGLDPAGEAVGVVDGEANARGFHDPEACITMVMLDRAGLTPKLPWATGA